ncbi:MAG: MFS transporter, partial [Planctomycetota bacterium]
FFVSFVPTVTLLALALYALRFCGQGLMGHTAMVTMARYFHAERGKALSVAALGFALGFAAFPRIAKELLDAVGWRDAWRLVGGVLAVALVPLVLWLLRGQRERHRRQLEKSGVQEGGPPPSPRAARQWTRAEVVRDPRFYLLLPAALAPPFLMTGLLIHQRHIIAAKGWSLDWYSTCFIGFGIMQWTSSLFVGALVDRASALRLFPWFLLPFGGSLLVLATASDPAAALVYLVLAGASVGAVVPVTGAAWAELYGVAHLGAIRALTSALMVFSTALAPVTMGWLFDAGTTVEALARMCAGYVALSVGLAALAARRCVSSRR